MFHFLVCGNALTLVDIGMNSVHAVRWILIRSMSPKLVLPLSHIAHPLRKVVQFLDWKIKYFQASFFKFTPWTLYCGAKNFKKWCTKVFYFLISKLHIFLWGSSNLGQRECTTYDVSPLRNGRDQSTYGQSGGKKYARLTQPNKYISVRTFMASKFITWIGTYDMNSKLSLFPNNLLQES